MTRGTLMRLRTVPMDSSCTAAARSAQLSKSKVWYCSSTAHLACAFDDSRGHAFFLQRQREPGGLLAHFVRRGLDSRERRQLAGAAVAIELQRGLQRGQQHAIGAQRARERVLAALLDQLP